jgi:hypothetical protein
MRRFVPAPRTRALPATVADLEAQRISRPRSLIDEVEEVYELLFPDEEFRKYRGMDDPDTFIEGSAWADDAMSALSIRAKGIERDMRLIMDADLTDLVTALRRAERRFNASRKQRRNAQEAVETVETAEAEYE